ncbi:putative THP3 like protein C2A9.11c [Glarea lozoyensis 74030]|uniref:Putative THP3 like protein C2A9.11c n=1 Tax=Glarea lozoyensis (strain ATCC 74030 / MF5533) TaxID=1104152 RepID=H0EIT0_GLAL7|nr:putative THP3 like protein C2A9.11c [Glarea lozoyensis 74030]
MNASWSHPPPPGTESYGYAHAPAYHPVQVRQSFNQPAISYQITAPIQPKPTEQPAQKKKIDWPQPVRDYVQRSFDPSNVLADVDRKDMEDKLKVTISEATDNNTLHTIDWANLPLPQHVIRQERATAAAAIAWQRESVNMQQMAGSSFMNPAREQMLKSKKRKSQDIGDAADDESKSIPPWRATNPRNGFEDRITYPADRFDKRQQPLQDDALKGTSKFNKALEKRQKRFDGGYKSTYKASPSPEPSSGPVIGTCQTLEKQYFRLTAPPIPSQVRPEHILRQTLDLLKKKWKKEGNYSYICDQFKSMRQDLTVQRIKNEFTVTVYEIHARIALEKGDLALGNYHRFFRLYLDTPNMGAYLMDMFVVRERLAALSNMCKAYKPNVKLRFVTEELGFESDGDAAQFIYDHNGQFLLEERESGLVFLTGDAKQIFETAKVAAFSKVDIKGQI